jgi:hypothetical protein
VVHLLVIWGEWGQYIEIIRTIYLIRRAIPGQRGLRAHPLSGLNQNRGLDQKNAVIPQNFFLRALPYAKEN